MPTYDYICDACGHEFETYESITATPRTDCPECKELDAAPKDRRRGGDPFQGIGLLPDRLSERVVQEGRPGGQVVERAGETGERIAKSSESTGSHQERAGENRACPEERHMIKVRCPICSKRLADHGDRRSSVVSVLLRSLPAGRPGALD